MTKKSKDPADFIVPLNMNGLDGRMLKMPPNKHKNREILFVYGHHALIERWWGLVQNLNDFGSVTIPDMPGFGGMESFEKIGKAPTIDNYADYLAAFIKLRYKNRRFTIVAISFGFVVVTRMLQRYPHLAKKVDLVVSLMGFMHRDDFVFSPRNQKILSATARLFATRPVSAFIRHACLNRFVIHNLYKRLPSGKIRLIDVDPSEVRNFLDFDVTLWQSNDVRTHWLTTSEFLKLDNCQKRVDLPVWHVATKGDPYFSDYAIKEHMLIVYKRCEQMIIDVGAHTPSIMAGKKEIGILLPPKLRRVLAKQ